MDELSEKLAGLLNDPETMSKVRKMAQGLFSEEKEEDVPKSSAPSFDFMPNAEELSKIMGVISRLNTKGNDPRSQLLLALKPHLSEPRREKVDTALKLLGLIDLLPIIYEMNGGKGIF